MKNSLAVVSAVFITLGTMASAQEYTTGQEAFANRDWEAAQLIWTQEAEAGSAEALLGLGNLVDFGLLGPSDPVAAFDLYRQAALLGDVEAAFNLGVMLDSGVGVQADKRAAAGWYSLAASEQFQRAQYNLGLLYALGDGVPANAELAKLWLSRAGTSIATSQDLLGSLDQPSNGELTEPEILQTIIVDDDGAPTARLAWAGDVGPVDSRYRVEVADLSPGSAANDVTVAETLASAIAIPLPSLPETAAVRVFKLTDTDYVVSPWTNLDGGPASVLSRSTVRFQIMPDDRRGLGYAERVGSSLERSGINVVYEIEQTEDVNSSVVYQYASDSGLATDVADFLPGIGNDGAEQSNDASLAPSEVLVRLVFRSAG